MIRILKYMLRELPKDGPRCCECFWERKIIYLYSLEGEASGEYTGYTTGVYDD